MGRTKDFKKFVAMVLCLAMVFSCIAPVMAAANENVPYPVNGEYYEMPDGSLLYPEFGVEYYNPEDYLLLYDGQEYIKSDEYYQNDLIMATAAADDVLATIEVGQTWEFRAGTRTFITLSADADYYIDALRYNSNSTRVYWSRNARFSNDFTFYVPAGYKLVLQNVGDNVITARGNVNFSEVRQLYTPVFFKQDIWAGGTVVFNVINPRGMYHIRSTPLPGFSWSERFFPGGDLRAILEFQDGTIRDISGSRWLGSGGIVYNNRDGKSSLTRITITAPGLVGGALRLAEDYTVVGSTPYRLTICGERSFPPGMGQGLPEPPPTPPDLPASPIDAVAAAEFIRYKGEFVYPLLIEGQTYWVYRIDGRVMPEGLDWGGFIPGEDFDFVVRGQGTGMNTAYLIGGTCGNVEPVLVTDWLTIQRAGFILGNDFRGEDAFWEKRTTMWNNVRVATAAYYEGVRRYHRREKTAEWLHWGALIAKAAIYAKKPTMQGTIALVVSAADRVIDRPTSINATDYFRALREASYNEFSRFSSELSENMLRNWPDPFYPAFNPLDADADRTLISYDAAVGLKHMTHLYERYRQYNIIAFKYIAAEIRGMTDRVLAGIVSAVFGVSGAFISEEVITYVVMPGAEGLVKMKIDVNIDLSADPDVIRAENNLVELYKNFYTELFHTRYMHMMGNTLLIVHDYLRQTGRSMAIPNQVVMMKCPVDVSVYDRAGNLIGQIIDDVVVYVSERDVTNPLSIAVVNGAKILLFPHGNDYRIEITAREEGVMTYLEFLFGDEGEIVSNTLVQGVLLEEGKEFTVNPRGDTEDYRLLLVGNEALTVTINVTAGTNGRIYSTGSGFVIGNPVFLTALPNAGFRFAGWYENGVRVYGEESYSFVANRNRVLEARFVSTATPPGGTRPGGGGGGATTPPTEATTQEVVTPGQDVTPELTAATPLPFTDVAATAWYYGYVRTVWGNSIFQGTADNQFSPQMNMTRAMFVQTLANLEGVDLTAYEVRNPTFNDVSSSAWHFAAVEWAAGQGIVLGVGNDNFAPNAPITREQMAAMLYRYIQVRSIEIPTNQIMTFADRDIISYWAIDAVETIKAAGIITGRPNGNFDPRTTAIRAEVAAIFARFLNVIGEDTTVIEEADETEIEESEETIPEDSIES